MKSYKSYLEGKRIQRNIFRNIIATIDKLGSDGGRETEGTKQRNVFTLDQSIRSSCEQHECADVWENKNIRFTFNHPTLFRTRHLKKLENFEIFLQNFLKRMAYMGIYTQG